MTYIQVLNRLNHKSRKIYLKGLDTDIRYVEEETGRSWQESTLINAVCW
jgi:hypothetical protein